MRTKRKSLIKRDIISYDDLEQYGLGSWVKKNANWLAPVALGAATIGTMGAAGLLAAPIAAGAGTAGAIGAGTAAAGTAAATGGVGLSGALAAGGLATSIGGSVGGAVTNNYNQQEAQDAQNMSISQQNAKSQAQGQLNTMQGQDPMQSYTPVVRYGGKLKKYTIGGPLTGGNTANTVELTPQQRGVTNKLKNYQGLLTGALAEKTKGVYNVDSILNANAQKPKFSRANIRTYADEIIKNQGDYALTPEEIKKTLGENYQDYVNSYDSYNKQISEYSGLVDTKGTVENAPDIASQNFGARQMIERFPWSKEEGTPYTYMQPKLAKKAMGGTLNYGGQLHEGPDGGNPVDGKGNVNLNNPTALVQKGEVGYNTEDGSTYIFSDDLYLDKKRTFANEAKKIQSKYSRRLGKNMIEKHDALASKGYNMDMKDLLGKQEQLREAKGIVDNTREMRKGGKLPKHEDGDYLKFVAPSAEDTLVNPTPYNSNYTPAEMGLTGPDLTPDAYTMGQNVNGKSVSELEGWTPDTGMGWQSAASLAAPIFGAITNRLTRKKPSKIKLDESGPTPQGISLERERAADREQANLTRANIRRNLKSGTSAQQYQANVGAAEVGVQRSLGQQLGESYQKEEAYNSGLSQQEAARSDQRNQGKLQADMYNSSIDAQTNAQNQNDITGVINAANMYGRDVQQSKKDMAYLQMLDPRYKMMSRRRNWRSSKEYNVMIDPKNIIE